MTEMEERINSRLDRMMAAAGLDPLPTVALDAPKPIVEPDVIDVEDEAPSLPAEARPTKPGKSSKAS